ncbi:MAG: hypothetical protein R3E83_11080 [Burkholderiaceae bacterium]
MNSARLGEWAGTAVGSDRPSITAIARVTLLAIVAAGVVWLVLSLGGAHSLQDDAAQIVSTARHWLAGDGLASSILYYESQLEQVMPARQTVWPPGMPLMAGVIAQLGLSDLAESLILLGLLAHVGTACLLVWLIGRTSPAGARIAWMVGIAWLIFVPAWLGAARGLADPPYQAFALLIACAMAWVDEPRHRRAGLVLAGLALAGALSMRYQAVALFGPVGLAVWAAIGGRRGFWQGVAVCLPAVFLLAALFARNWMISGSLSGGAHSGRGQTWTEIAARITWVPHVLREPALLVLTLLAVLAALTAAWLAWRRLAPQRGRAEQVRACAARASLASESTPAADAGGLGPAVRIFCLSGFAANLLLLIVLALNSTVYVLEMRYVLAAGLLLVPVLATVRVGALARHAAWIPALALAQMLLLWPGFLQRVLETPTLQMREALLEESVGNEDALRWLRRRAEAGEVVMSTHPHGLSLLTGGAMVGVPLPVYVSRPYDAERIHALALRHDVHWLVAFRSMPTWVFRDPLNTMIDRDPCTPWLNRVIDAPGLLIARVERSASHDCRSAQPPTRPQPRLVSSESAGA